MTTALARTGRIMQELAPAKQYDAVLALARELDDAQRALRALLTAQTAKGEGEARAAARKLLGLPPPVIVGCKQ